MYYKVFFINTYKNMYYKVLTLLAKLPCDVTKFKAE